MIPLWVFGGGGHARVVIDTARASGLYTVMGILDDHGRYGHDSEDGVPVVGPITLEMVFTHEISHAVIAVGNNHDRAAIAARMSGDIRWVTLVHPRAYVAGSVQVGAGTVICAMSVVQPGSEIGEHVVINTSASVDHGNRIHDFVHIGPGVNLAGMVTIEQGAFLGTGANVIPWRRVGAWATVGSGAVVTTDLPSSVTAVGVPARVIKAFDSTSQVRNTPGLSE